jgi:hypothetical protein
MWHICQYHIYANNIDRHYANIFVFLLVVREFALMVPKIRTNKKAESALLTRVSASSSSTPNSAHSSTAGVTEFLSPSVAGFLLQKELDYLGGAVFYIIHTYAPVYMLTHTHTRTPTHTHVGAGRRAKAALCGHCRRL